MTADSAERWIAWQGQSPPEFGFTTDRIPSPSSTLASTGRGRVGGDRERDRDDCTVIVLVRPAT
ncbi:hypothetical protein BGK67_00315 [Streptomyces subrutilus]|uniref:Uncharacterized protein n=1 Tax=Streptomyces subrutilus TaxID=36818 RepID=A0A1E5PKE3_9ACTN|nr:hypothetical protein BGK67_00315 [Streptomyces subrutilus]